MKKKVIKKSHSKDWIAIKRDYLSGKKKISEIAREYNVAVTTIKRHAEKENWSVNELDYNVEHLKMYEDCARILRALTKSYLENDIEPDLGALQKIVAALEKIQKGQRVSLGMDKDAGEVNLPKINIVKNLDKNKI